MVATPTLDLGIDAERLVIAARGGDSVDLPGSADILNASFRQIGDDLLIEPPAGRSIIVQDYFAQVITPDLVIDGRAHLDGALVERLSSSRASTQVAEDQSTLVDAGGVQLAQAGDPIGEVESVTGTVSVQRADGSTAELAAGDPIFLNDVVQAASDGTVGIVFIDGTTFSLSAGARMTMDEMVYDPASGGGNFVTSVLQGTFVFSTGSIAPNGNMEVNTPVGTIGIRGTTVAARIAIEGSDTIIILLPDEDGNVGRVIIQNAGGIQEITEANAATTVTSFFIAPGQPVVMSGTEVLQYFDEVLQQLRAIQSAAPADEQGGAAEDQDAADQALLDSFDPSDLSTAAGGDEEGAEGEQAADLEAVDELSELLGFVPDPLQPVSFFTLNLFGKVGFASGLFGTTKGFSGSGITLDYLDPSSGLPVTADGSPYIFFTGGAGNDILDASEAGGPSFIIGSAGDDLLIGSPNDDQIFGNAGNDTIVAGHGGGDDVIDGGTDNDTVIYASADESIIVDLTAGKAFGDPDIGVDTLSNIENVVGGSGNDVIIGNAVANKLDGNGGDDQLSGLGGDDTLDGNIGVDTAVFTGVAADYDIVLVTEGGYIEVTDLRPGGDGTDVLYNIERLRFSDQETLVSDLEEGLNRAPTTIELKNMSIAEEVPGAVVGDIVVADPDFGDFHEFQLSDDRFEVVAGQLRLKDGIVLDHETEPSVEVTITAIDTGGLGHTKSFVITVEDANDAPTVPIDVDDTANVIGEDAVAGTAVGVTAFSSDEDAGHVVAYSLSDDANGRFVIDAATGVISVAADAALDFEGDGAYDVVVTATSDGGLTADKTFTIQLSDAQEALGPINDIDGDASLVAENAVLGATVGITVRAIDPDAGDTVSYSLSDSAGGRFAIDAVTGVVTVAAALDYESATSHDITVLATSSDGSSNSQNFTIQISNVNDNPVVGPVDSNGAANLVAENTAIGTAVGITATASDADTGATISYTLSDNAGGRFEISGGTGVVTVAAALDHESATSHDITVLVTSSDGSSNSQNFTIQISNVNDNPVVGPVD
ncbi:MAG: cadherin domain-containing protein, partial [Rhodospirillaceae bacterium]|nr:cadherin domain-containing protein [Rhodospirillaceae bacterium]